MSISIKNKFNSKPVYNEKYLKTKRHVSIYLPISNIDWLRL